MTKLAYNIQETGKMLSVSKSTIYNLIQDGSLKAVKIRGAMRVTHDAILAYLEKSQINKAA